MNQSGRSTVFSVGQVVRYREKEGRIVEAQANDRGLGVVRDEMRDRLEPGQWVSNLGTGGRGMPGDGGMMFRLEPVGSRATL